MFMGFFGWNSYQQHIPQGDGPTLFMGRNFGEIADSGSFSNVLPDIEEDLSLARYHLDP